MKSPKYLFWRNLILWCRYPVEGWPDRYSLRIRSFSDAKAAKAKVERDLGMPLLARIQASKFDPEARKVLEKELRLFEKIRAAEKEPERIEPYRPTYCALAMVYWCNTLSRKKCSDKDRYHLYPSLRKFGALPANEIRSQQIYDWIEEQKAAGYSINAINNQLAKVKAVYNSATRNDDPRYSFLHNPAANVKKLPGGNIRQALLTPELFERNYAWFMDTGRWQTAFLYLMLWETGRRPEEVVQYTWEMVNEVFVDGYRHRVFRVPGYMIKTPNAQDVAISPRLWAAMFQLPHRDGVVARNHYGNPWKNWEHPMLLLRTQFGEGGPTWFRDNKRGAVTRWIEDEGHPVTSVMDQTGNKTMSCLLRYRIGKIRNQIRVVGADRSRDDAADSRIA